MSERILFVDDEPFVLDGYKRILRESFSVDTASSGEIGLATIQRNGPYAVVVSDMRMPGMSGAEFLTQVRQKSPESVRMLLTGHADLNMAIDAVNQGSIFRFLTKPCDKEELTKALHLGLVEYQTAIEQKELLRKAKLIERTATDEQAADVCQWDNGESPTGLPGPSQARSLLAPLLRVDLKCYVALFKITMLQTVEQRYGEEAAGDYLNYAAQFLIQGLRPDDRLFHWGRDVLMAVVHRQISLGALRMEMDRLTLCSREYVMQVNGKRIMTACPISFDVLPASQFSAFDDMMTAFGARAGQADLTGSF
jgi:FixJ family two-component response regulator